VLEKMAAVPTDPSTGIALDDDLARLLGSCGLDHKCNQALEWCLDEGADTIEDIITAEAQADFTDALDLKPIKRRKLLEALGRRAKGDRTGESSGDSPPPELLSQAQALASQVTHGGNRSVPPQHWGMTVAQFNSFIAACKGDQAKWDELAASTENGKAAGIVNGYQLNEAFVKPFTRGTGCSVALLLNPEKPLEAAVMVSHTWAEDILEVHNAVNDRAFEDGEPESLVIWLSLFANYQAEDGAGLTMAEQLAPALGSVIRFPTLKYMCVVVTSTHDPYARLWVVYELDIALDVMEERMQSGLPGKDFIKVEFSQTAWDVYRKKIQSWSMADAVAVGLTAEQWEARQTWGPEYAFYQQAADCENTSCSHIEHRDMLLGGIQNSGGWRRLNHRVAEFRKSCVTGAMVQFEPSPRSPRTPT